ncbi:phage holin family protein [Pseudomonas viridiflava]|uniref:phage holin family protein n=1 Tax=Pseudomonas viridiflava TaxID=33069 RepID=UPI001967D47D|nr:phage holin family protein [Pseudomonas viridiflava]
MPEKNPGFWAQVWVVLSTPDWQGAIMTATISLLRILYEAKETNKRPITFESLLPGENKRALGFDFVVGSEGEEMALNHLARLFMDYANLSFRRALVARRRRLGADE